MCLLERVLKEKRHISPYFDGLHDMSILQFDKISKEFFKFLEMGANSSDKCEIVIKELSELRDRLTLQSMEPTMYRVYNR